MSGIKESIEIDRRPEAEWWPDVRRELAGFQPKTAHDAVVLERIGQSEHDPEWILASYPAHMHINLLPQVQACGCGRSMMETELAALSAYGAAGAFVGVSPVNERAKSFYRQHKTEGFSHEQIIELSATLLETGPGVSAAQVTSATEAHLVVSDQVRQMAL